MTIVLYRQVPKPLANLATRDLIVLLYIVGLGISRLRWSVPGIEDIDVLRGELRRREGAM